MKAFYLCLWCLVASQPSVAYDVPDDMYINYLGQGNNEFDPQLNTEEPDQNPPSFFDDIGDEIESAPNSQTKVEEEPINMMNMLKRSNIRMTESEDTAPHNINVETDEDSNTDESNLLQTVEKRQRQRGVAYTIREGESLPWICPQRREWRSLHGVYPTRVLDTICESNTCFFGHFNCSRVTYTTQLLQLCYNSTCSGRDSRVPYNFRSSWRFVERQMTAGCMCSR